MSNPFGGFNQRPAEPAPKPTPVPVEGTAVPPAPGSRFKTKNTDYTPSEAPDLLPGLAGVGKIVAETLRKEEFRKSEIALDAFGVDGWKRDAARLDQAVRAGEITKEDAARIFRTLNPDVTPDQLGGQS